MDFAGREIPGGKEFIEQSKGFLASVGFDPQRDLFSWWGGEMISVDMPAAVVTPMSNADAVLMIRVKNPEVAAQKVNALIDFVAAQLKAVEQTLIVQPAAGMPEGFREVTHQYIALMFRPVIGVKDEWLVMGTSAASVGKCFDVAAGKAPSIAENDRFKREGLKPSGPVLSLSFKDTSKFGQEVASVAGAISFAGPMLTTIIPDDGNAETKQGKRVLSSVLSMVGKLSMAASKIDFYSSEASMTTYDGQLTVRTEKVVTYRAEDAGAEKRADGNGAR